MPIRLRLTLWYGLLLGLTLLVFCVALYLALQAALERDFDEILRVRAAQVERELIDSAAGDQELTPEEISPDDLEPSTLEELAEPGVYVQVLSRRGEVLATSGTLLPVHAALVASALDGREGFATDRIAADQQLRTLYWPVRDHERVIAVVQVAETLQLLHDTLRDARNLMLTGAVALLVAAMGSGWFLTRRALQPVAAVTEAAQHIAQTGRFERRVGPVQPRDELSALAATFDVMIDRLERTMRQQRDLLADTSHELRTPLAVIRGNLDYIRRVSTDPSCLEAVHESEIEAERMSRLVNDLLLLAQADTADFLAPSLIRLDSLIRELGEQAQTVADGVAVEVETGAELWVRADPDRLRQAVWNLMDNALRYTPPGGRVRLEARADGTDAVLGVCDTGPGVPPGHEARIFERFYRADRSRARATGGAGLGLAIVKHIAEAHDGSVHLENHPGEGATFVLKLPAAAPPDRSWAEPTIAEGPARPG